MSAQGRIVGGVLAAVIVIAGFWFALIAPKRAETATVKDRIAQAQARQQAAIAAAATAEQAREDYQHDYATVARLGKAVPADDDVASLVYQLESVARDNKIDFRAMKLASGGTPAAPATGTTPANSEDPKESKDSAPTPAATTPTPAVTQAPPGAVVGAAGLLTLPFSFTFDGGYLPMQRMLGAIDGLADATKNGISVRGRLLTVDGFSLTKGRTGFPRVKAVVSTTAYIVPPAQGVTGQATAQGPAAASGATSGTPSTSASMQGIAP